MDKLTWGLVIATKDRLEPLKICVELALKQTRSPVEVVIVDASSDWQKHARLIGDLLEPRPDIRLVFEQATLPSLTVQRNQAVQKASADIVFMVDDDSFMHPSCAEEIMAIYEADTTSAVAGVQACETAELKDIEIHGARKQNVDVSKARDSSRILRWVFRKVFMMGMTEVFIPYDGAFHDWPVPETLKAADVSPARVFGGFRMTYRRKFVVQSPFDPILRYYCPGEDLDGSYRISRLGGLLTANRAYLHHYASASGRLNRFQVAFLWSLNQAVLLRRHAPNQKWARRVFARRITHRILSDILKDLLMRRFSMPQFRGTARAAIVARRVFAMSDKELEDWYPALQEKIVKS